MSKNNTPNVTKTTTLRKTASLTSLNFAFRQLYESYTTQPPILPGERAEDFFNLAVVLAATYQPKNEVHWLWVMDHVVLLSEKNRYARIKSSLMAGGISADRAKAS